MDMGKQERLGPEDWTGAALDAIAEGGIATVSVERLATGLGATKGSFYWHFADRPALIEAAIARWEVESTDAVIEALAGVDEPIERFRRLLAEAFVDRRATRIDANLVADAATPVVAAALARVSAKRLAFVRAVLDEAGVPDPRDRAVLALSAYVGLVQLRRTAPDLTPSSRRARAYVDHAVATLTAR